MKPTTPRARAVIVERLATLWTTIDIETLHDAIHLRLAGHPRAASYEPRTTPTATDADVKLTPVEAAASHNAAAAHLDELARLLDQADRIEQRIHYLRRLYPVWSGPTEQVDDRHAPAGMCRDCWAAGIHDQPAADGRYRDRCRPCGEWFAEHQRAKPAALVRVTNERGRLTTALIREHAPYAT